MVESHPALLTKTEIRWLLGNAQVSKCYEYRIKSDIKGKLKTFQQLELPLLQKREYGLDLFLTSNPQNLSANSQLHRRSQAAAQRGVGNHMSMRERRGEWDSNPRVLSDMGLAIPRPTRLGDPRPHLKQLQLTLY